MANVVTNVGKGLITGRIKGSAANEPNQLAWGTGAGTTAATDTTLFTEASESRVACTTTQQTTTTTDDTYQAVGTLTVAGADKTITNVGLFDAATAGNLFVKSDFTGLALAVGDSIAFTLKVQMQ